MDVEPFLADEVNCPFEEAQELSYSYAIDHNFDLLDYDNQRLIWGG